MPEATNKNTNAAGLTPEQVGQEGGWEVGGWSTCDWWPTSLSQSNLLPLCITSWPPAPDLTVTQVRNLKTAIAKASSLDEIERLNQMLRAGTVSIVVD